MMSYSGHCGYFPEREREREERKKLLGFPIINVQNCISHWRDDLVVVQSL